MANANRLWCVARDNGSIIDIGGQFKCGDCALLRQALADLISSGYLPVDGDFGGGKAWGSMSSSFGLTCTDSHSRWTSTDRWRARFVRGPTWILGTTASTGELAQGLRLTSALVLRVMRFSLCSQ